MAFFRFLHATNQLLLASINAWFSYRFNFFSFVTRLLIAILYKKKKNSKTVGNARSECGKPVPGTHVPRILGRVRGTRQQRGSATPPSAPPHALESSANDICEVLTLYVAPWPPRRLRPFLFSICHYRSLSLEKGIFFLIYHPNYLPGRFHCTLTFFCLLWVRKISLVRFVVAPSGLIHQCQIISAHKIGLD